MIHATIETESPTKETEQQTHDTVVDVHDATTKQQTIQSATTSIISNELMTCKYGLPPLLCASNSGRCQAVEQALSIPGVDVNVRTTSNNFTALMLAARASTCCTRNILRMLLQAGVKVNAVDDDGFSPLMAAIIWAPNDTVACELAQLLVQYGANTQLQTIDGRMALDFAAHAAFTEKTIPYLSRSETLERHGSLKRRVRSLVTTLAKGRLVIDASDEGRGPQFGSMTHWLDTDLLEALAGNELSEAEIRLVLKAIRKRHFFKSLKDLVEQILGSEYVSIC